MVIYNVRLLDSSMVYSMVSITVAAGSGIQVVVVRSKAFGVSNRCFEVVYKVVIEKAVTVMILIHVLDDSIMNLVSDNHLVRFRRRTI